MASHRGTACDSIRCLALGVVLTAWRAAICVWVTSYLPVLNVGVMLDVSSTPEHVLHAPYTDHKPDQYGLKGQWLVFSKVVVR